MSHHRRIQNVHFRGQVERRKWNGLREKAVPSRQILFHILVLKWRILMDSLVLYFVLLYDQTVQNMLFIRYCYLICCLLLHNRSQKLESVRKTWIPKAPNQGWKLLAEVGFLMEVVGPGQNPGRKCFFGHEKPWHACSLHKFCWFYCTNL